MRWSVFALIIAGCLPYERVARLTVDPETCGEPAVVTKLKWWAFRVDACGATTYVRCSGGFKVCCWPTTRDDAVSTFGDIRFDVEQTCVNKDPCSVSKMYGSHGASFEYVDDSLCRS